MALDKEDIKQLIAILQKGLADDDETEHIETKPNRRKRSTKKAKKSKYKNLFDSMPEASAHKEDIEIDKRLRTQPLTQRSRSYKPLKVKCRVCGKEESVNPVLIESVERYKCNRCSTSAG